MGGRIRAKTDRRRARGARPNPAPGPESRETAFVSICKNGCETFPAKMRVGLSEGKNGCETFQAKMRV